MIRSETTVARRALVTQAIDKQAKALAHGIKGIKIQLSCY